MRWWLRIAGLAAAAQLAACTVGPDYRRPTVEVPAGYKELRGWKPAQPQDDQSRGAWWSVYKDPTLDDLERQIDISNQTLKAAAAAYRQARAATDFARAGFFPAVSLNATAQHSRQPTNSQTITELNITADAAWEPDLWGRISRTVEAQRATAQASAADLASARLSAQALLATDYLELRVADALKRLLDSAATAYTRSLEIARNQYASGVGTKSDVAQALAQLRSTEAQAINVGVSRAQLEHAIAVLIGKPPADLSIVPALLLAEVPDIPVDVPSTLLERRPDIAAAERTVASANAQIGVAIAAYFPTLTLTASGGTAGAALADLSLINNPVWAVGAAAAVTLLDFGARSAQVNQARATYDQTVAEYRQTVLTGFAQVEDQLAALRILSEQAEVQDAAVQSAEEAERLILNQYKAGTLAYTSVVTAQTAALGDEQTALTIRQNRLVASVALIEALGGGWNAGQSLLVQ